MKKLIFLPVVLPFVFFFSEVCGQNPTKESRNAFAQFTKTGDVTQLEAARKHIDESYKTARDSSTQQINLIRAMVYSALSVKDSNRTFSYNKDPLAEASYALGQLTEIEFKDEHRDEINYIKNRMAQAHLYIAKESLNYGDFEKAARAFSIVDSLAPGNLRLTYNLALLHEKAGNINAAITYYVKLVEADPHPAYYFNLAELYNLRGDTDLSIETLQLGRIKFPDYKDLVFKELNHFSATADYQKIIDLVPNALELEPYSIPLNYLAGFSYQKVGNVAKAQEYYEKILNINPNNYDANYALGLLYLNLYVSDQSKNRYQYTALQHLSRANEIDPYQLKTLQSLAILYRYTDNQTELKRVNSKINQLKFN